MTERDWDRVLEIRQQSFNIPSDQLDVPRRFGVERNRVWEEDGTILAAANWHELGHFFGGCSVPAAGVAGVVVAAEGRGHRIAERLVGQMVASIRDTFPLTSLHPATVPLYRRIGYEYALMRTRYTVRIERLPRFPDAIGLVPWDDADLDDVAEAQRENASRSDGTVDRSRAWWENRILLSWNKERIYRYLVREDGRVTGSVVYTQEKDFHFEIACRDLFWTTPRALRSILTFFARHASLGQSLSWFGAPFDPLAVLVPDDHARREIAEHIQYAMVRLLDVQAAVSLRGYAPTATGSVSIAVDDALVPQNRGPWRITVEGGKGFVEPAKRADATVPVHALSAIYTGFLGASDARRAGLLDAPDAVVSALTAMFSAPMPYLTDFF